ncbi:hypothetical protein CL658_05375 [bacterium]|nr:hypothetical protein [bacterium]
MKNHHLYKTTNIPITNSKGFQALLTSISYLPHQIAIICNNKAHVSNLEETLHQNEAIEIPPLIISISDLIDLSYSQTYAHNKPFLILYLKTYLSHFQHNAFRKTLYQSYTLMENVILYFIEYAITNDPYKTKKTLFDSETTALLTDLYQEFTQYLSQTYTINLKSYYKTRVSSPKLAAITELVFINTSFIEPWSKHCLYNTLQKTPSTWLLDTSFEHEINWLEHSFPNINSIFEEHLNPLNAATIKEYETHNQEIEATLHKIHTLSNKNPNTTFRIIIPKNPAYKQSINQILLKYNIAVNTLKKREITQNIIDSFVSLLTFIKTPFSLESLTTMTSHPWLHYMNQNDSIINIQHIKQYIPNHNKQSPIETIKATLKAIKQNDKTSIHTTLETQLENIIGIYTYHKTLIETKTPSKWLEVFIPFIRYFNVFNTLEKTNKDAYKSKEKLLDFIAIQLTYLNTLPPSEHYSSLYCDWLIQTLNHQYHEADTQTQIISIEHIETTLFKPHTINFILGLNHSMYQNIDIKKDYFETLKTLYQPTRTNPSHSLLNSHLINLHSNDNTLWLSSAKTIHDTQTIPLNIIKTEPAIWKEMHPKKRPLKCKNTNKTNKNIINKNDKITFSELSATMIDTYQSCPYKFWLYYVLKLDPLEPDQQNISAKEWGIVIHQIMEAFNKWLIKHPPPTKKTSLNILIKICKNILSNYPNNAIWTIKRHKLLGHQSNPGLVHSIIDIYHDNDYLLSPINTETKHHITINQTIIKGVVDALFQTKTGKVIIDYKTGKNIASPSDIKNGKSLQLPIYLLCKQTDIIEALIYFQIHNQEKTSLTIPACQESFKKTYIEKRKRPFLLTPSFPKTIKNHIHSLIELIQDNHFTHEAHPKLSPYIKNTSSQCHFCENTITCRNPNQKNQ